VPGFVVYAWRKRQRRHTDDFHHLSVVSLRDLTLVQAVRRYGSFNSAARAMHISPSGLSHQVQKVEQALGAPLFERGGRRVVPTAGGQRLLEQIDAVLLAAEHLQQAARAGETAFGGELRLGVLGDVGSLSAAASDCAFPAAFSRCKAESFRRQAARLAASPARRRARRRTGAAVRRSAASPIRPLFFEPWEVMLRADHPLAGKRTISLDQLDDGEAILMAESHADEKGYVQDVSLESLAALVTLRGGHALVPALAHDRLASMPDIVLARGQGRGAWTRDRACIGAKHRRGTWRAAGLCRPTAPYCAPTAGPACDRRGKINQRLSSVAPVNMPRASMLHWRR
jgi:LysR family hydrogen peroxide-inducible transcriptional activator